MRQRLALLAMLFLPHDPGTLFALARSASTSIVWISPTSKTTYAPGDTITGKWKISKALVSPSVSLCVADSIVTRGRKTNDDASDSCGKELWPDIADDGDQYSFSLATPDMDDDTESSSFYLKLKDDFGHVEKSPKFVVKVSSSVYSSSPSSPPSSLSSSGDSAVVEPAASVDETLQSSSESVPSETQTQAPETAPASPSPIAVQADSGTSATSTHEGASTKPSSKAHNTANIQPDATAQAGFMTAVAGSTGTSGNGTTITTISVQSLAPAQLSTNNHAQISAIAVAIPLALVAVALIASVLMCYVHQRSMASQRKKNIDLLATSGNMVHSTSLDPHAGPSDVEKAIDALYSYEQVPPQPQGRPIYIPVQAKHPIPRTDARRDRLYMPYNSRASTPGTYVERQSYHSDYAPYTGGLLGEKRRFVVENTHDMDDSATEAVLSEYLSTPSHMYRSESSRSFDSRRLHHPPQLHSRCSAPDSYYEHRHSDVERDVYEAVSRVVSQSRSHDSYSSFRY
ncbi:hypothetical protein SCHPADRAFT_27048 [Schizopora paradoxa]|uniref:Uncharacterized protein n=1 Tax=Schizopora paradoxa TaxID=27342 RepID=A0A0H2SE88_9AGAM|nr:hypothetical protein SCHPADRAFT_27048 [Schizopora paradoxa]